MTESNGYDKIIPALLKAQSTMGALTKSSKNPFFKSKYADIADVFEVLREPFEDNNLCLTQSLQVMPCGKRTSLKTMIFHESGQFLESSILLPEISDPQKIGSSITYYRRYSVMAMAKLVPVDDDGNEASGHNDAKRAKAKADYEKRANAKKTAVNQVAKVDPEKAKFIRKKLRDYPDYEKQIDQFLLANKMQIEDLTVEFAERISLKINDLEEEAISLLREARG